MRDALAAAAKLNIPVVQHAEDTRQTAGCSMNLGPTSFRLGLRGMPNSAEASMVERDIALARELNAHLHVAHLSTLRGAGRSSPRKKPKACAVTAEVTPHHFTLVDDNIGEFDTHYKMNPPLRSAADRRALIEGIADGTIDAIATDHAPHAFHEKQVEFERAAFGITGLETALADRHHGVASSLQDAAVAHRRAAVVESCEDIWASGPWNAGSRLARRRHHLRSQEEVDLRRVASPSPSRSNTPFDGWSFTGKAVATIVGGEIVYQD